MNLMTRLKKIERRMGPLTYEEYDEASERQGLRLQHLLFRKGFLQLAARRKKNPGGEAGPTESDLADIEVPEPPPVDMSAEGFSKDQDIIDAYCPDYNSRRIANGRSEKEMLDHFFTVATKASRENRNRS